MSAIFISAFLLFQIQPLIGKYILPWFGGLSSVWSTLLLLFQVLLLVGYIYAHGLINRLQVRKQGIVHLVLLGVSLALMLVAALIWQSPITPSIGWRPTNGSSPIWEIVKIFAVSAGLPYLLLSTNSPLIQAWFNEDHPGCSPYWLYALSNLGSFLALITYPILVETALTVRTQGWLWSLGYVVYAILLGAGALRRIRARNVLPAAHASMKQRNDVVPRPTIGLQLLWVTLAATASIMLLAVTSQITQEVAVIPFLWVLPLTIYLFSFVLTFFSERLYWRGFYGAAFAVVSGLLIWVLARGVGLNYLVQIGAYSLLLFVCCMFCHGELVRLKPHPRHLTLFYLMVSLGGAIGGIFVNMIAPFIFKGFWELQLGVVACWMLLLLIFLINPPHWQPLQRGMVVVLIAAGGLFVADVLVTYIQLATSNTLAASRNFYGVLRTRPLEPEPGHQAYSLSHGTTTHGFEYLDVTRRRQPTTYYTETSGIGLAIANHPKRGQGMNIGVLGLGIGTLAAYGQENDRMRFYEINPEVIRWAEGENGYFHFLSDCPCHVTTVLGDARISLERELITGQNRPFDLLVLDTFNSDSIPIHLLTSQALEVYLQRMTFNGVLALHVTNRHLDLLPLVRQLADAHGLQGRVVDDPGDGFQRYHSTWALLSRDTSFLQSLSAAENSSLLTNVRADVRLWTDDYSNLIQILK